MPKLIDYPRTSYAGAWEVADIVDDTGGKCALDTCARKLNRKVSGSFKAIIGSAVKFGLLTSKRELLTTTTLFRRIKHAYDKQEELLFHREAFLTPPLFTQLCRKFRSRELPVQMLDIMLIREFDVEEINAQGAAKAFIDGARMVGLLDERNMVADIDQLAAQQPHRRELASPELSTNSFRAEVARTTHAGRTAINSSTDSLFATTAGGALEPRATTTTPAVETATLVPPAASIRPTTLRDDDAVASLFGLSGNAMLQPSQRPAGREALTPDPDIQSTPSRATAEALEVQIITLGATTSGSPLPLPPHRISMAAVPTGSHSSDAMISGPAGLTSANTTAPKPLPLTRPSASAAVSLNNGEGFRIELSGPGLNTVLDVQDEEDLALARVLLDKIGRQLSQRSK